MNVAAMRSPASLHAKQPFAPQQRQGSYSHPSMSPQQHAPSRGLGLYPCSMPPLHQSTLSEISHSPQPSEWSQSSMMESEYSQPAQPPDIFSAAFDPFSSFPSTTTGSSNLVGSHSPTEAPGLEYCQTPPSSIINSHRSSVSSYAASEASDCAYTPRGKTEEQGEWYPSANNEHVLQRSMPTAGPLSYAPSSATLSSQTEDLYRSQPAEWTKNETHGYITELHATPDGRLPRFDTQPVLPSVNRLKKKRQRTTPEEATHECQVCGKLFKRSYNWKSHLETHNPERKYPHPCTANVGSTPCNKRFQRKTDLDRHFDSVHLKARNHKCNLCGNRFARRDTLRRHIEDGCPKRFELGIREQLAATSTSSSTFPPPSSSAAPSYQHHASFSGPSPSSMAERWTFPPPASVAPSYAQRSRSYSVALPLTTPMAPPQSNVAASAYPMFSRPEYVPASYQS